MKPLWQSSRISFFNSLHPFLQQPQRKLIIAVLNSCFKISQIGAEPVPPNIDKTWRMTNHFFDVEFP